MIVGLDASNIRAGGGVTHLVEVLRAADPNAHGFSEVIVWSGRETLDRIEDRPWLVKAYVPILDKSLSFRTFWQVFRLTPMARAAGCDVLLIPGGSYIGRFRPMVAFHQNLLPFQWSELRRFGWSWTTVKLLLLRSTQSYTFRRANGVIFLTEQARDAVVRVLGQLSAATTIVPHGIDQRFVRPPRPQRPISDYSAANPFKLLYVSIINVYKHQWHVAEAVAQLRRSGLPVALDLVGPAYAPALVRLNETLDRVDPQREFIKYVGEIPYDKLHSVYASADLCVFASTCETFGQILTEGMSAGLPVASSTQAAMRELLGDAGVYFDPEKPDEIAGALRQLIESPDLRAEKAAAAFSRTADLSWRLCATSTFAHFAEVVRRKGSERLETWCRPDTEVRVAVEGWQLQHPIAAQFMERPLSPRLVWNYLRHVGFVAVSRKIRSRLAERIRNRKIAGIGTGRVVAAPEGGKISLGQRVLFFAPNHSPDWPHLCLDAGLIAPIADAAGVSTTGQQVTLPPALERYIGWSSYSGVPLQTDEIRSSLAQLAIAGTGRPAMSHRRTRTPLFVSNPREPSTEEEGVPSAVLFGLGSYAKTQIIPQVRRHLRLKAIHEIDPDQLATARRFGVRLDTTPGPRSWERYDAWFIAGFHHTHASLALHALRTGGYAVVEKPLVTTAADYGAISSLATELPERRIFTCFQKRYSRLNDWARKDLGLPAGDPVDMHCIVYEIPVPALHWYNWPNSGSRLVSNGCHWLDYFMFLNAYSPVKDTYAHPLRGNDIAVMVTLENGSQLTMTITDTGSERLGVREVIDLRAGNVTVRMVDAGNYEAENTHRVLRRGRVNPMDAYKRMYDAICLKIVRGEQGDTLESLRSTALMIDLDAQLRDREPART